MDKRNAIGVDISTSIKESEGTERYMVRGCAIESAQVGCLTHRGISDAPVESDEWGAECPANAFNRKAAEARATVSCDLRFLVARGGKMRARASDTTASQ
jgi:hypothetical protein